MVWWLMHLSLDQAVWVEALAGDIVILDNTLNRHSTCTSLHPCVQTDTGKCNVGGNPAVD